MNRFIIVKITQHSRLNPTDEEVDTLRQEIDADDSGVVEFKEFLRLMSSETLR